MSPRGSNPDGSYDRKVSQSNMRLSEKLEAGVYDLVNFNNHKTITMAPLLFMPVDGVLVTCRWHHIWTIQWLLVYLRREPESRCKMDFKEMLQKIVGTNHGATLLKEEEFDVESFHTSAWNNRRSSVIVRHDFMCDRQDSFSACHNDRQVFKFQISIVHHIQKTSTNCEWPARSADCRTRCPV